MSSLREGRARSLREPAERELVRSESLEHGHVAAQRRRIGLEEARGAIDTPTFVLSPGRTDMCLVVLHDGKDAFERRLSLVVRLWGTTSRESDVLRWLVLGDSNKEIACRLKCHEGTVERHVTSILRKTRCDGRSRLVARFWTAQ